jgi:riboflavin synthase
VQGHVDGVGEVLEVVDDGFARRLRVALPEGLMRYVIDKGSLALDGVSLTIADLGDSWVSVSLIPETLERTALGEAKPGGKVNVECDLVAKYVERLVKPFAGKDRT